MYIPAWPSLAPSSLLKNEITAQRPFPLDSARSNYFYVARYGIYHLFRNLGLKPGDTVLVPDYHHGNEVLAIRAAGASITYYPVKHDLTADLDTLAILIKKRPRVLYVTHFVGWPQPLAELRGLCRSAGVMLIEDCALSFLSSYAGAPLGSFGDYSVFCLYKTLPLPNGGVICANGPEDKHREKVTLVRPNRLSVASRSAELILQWLRIRYELPGRALFALKRRAGATMRTVHMNRVPVGNTGFDAGSANLGMSPTSHRLVGRFDYDGIRRKRQRNYLFLENALKPHVALLPIDLSEDVCPLFFPLLVDDKRLAFRSLWALNIESVEFWNEGDPEALLKGSATPFLRHHVLELPIHQDVTLDHLDFMARQILRLKLGMSRGVSGRGQAGGSHTAGNGMGTSSVQKA